MATRHDGRAAKQLRPLRIERGFTSAAAGSTLIEAGQTAIICAASLEESVPPWLVGSGKGWITAEYNMLPGSTRPRKTRERGAKVDGRTTEIQRLIGRSLRAVADLRQLGERTVTVDCDVLRADGGTRTLSITGGMIALVDALVASRIDAALVLRESVAAVSVGIVEAAAVLDLDYREDVAAAVDMNVVMTASGQFIEIQGTGEEATFSDAELTALLGLARNGISELVGRQREALSADWPW
jgi:ribonuclease PH